MIEDDPFALANKPLVLGTGLVALDVVLSGDSGGGESTSVYAGGTCGNVLAILAWFGWSAMPVARLGADDAGQQISNDLRRFGVNMKFARLRPRAATPIVVEKIRKTAEGHPKHHFSMNCPVCGSWLPRYQPVTIRSLGKVVAKQKSPTVFFFDRASPGAIYLARAYSEAGALIVFEPSGQATEKLQKEAIRLSDICKYSAEQFPAFCSNLKESPGLEIQTLGSNGVRFRSKTLPGQDGKWKALPAVSVGMLKDSAGAGDWFSAGLIHALGVGAAKDFKVTTAVALNNAIKFALTLAAWNCQFEGARGGMYAVTEADFREQIRRIAAGCEVVPTNFPALRNSRLRRFTCRKAVCRA